jgi:hypothetical protein
LPGETKPVSPLPCLFTHPTRQIAFKPGFRGKGGHPESLSSATLTKRAVPARPKRQTNMTKKEKIDGLEFRIAFSETNLRWIAGEPATPETQHAKKSNVAYIAEAKAEIERLKKGWL